MALTKHAATKKPSSKCARIDSDHFKFVEADMKYNDCYKDKTIIMERVVQLESLEGTFIPEVFKERICTKLLNPIRVVYLEITKEFFSNAVVNGDRIKYWVRHKEFVITRDSIQEYLKIRPPSQPISEHGGNSWWYSKEVFHEYNPFFTRDEGFGTCDDP